jgi:hypothetical protein
VKWRTLSHQLIAASRFEVRNGASYTTFLPKCDNLFRPVAMGPMPTTKGPSNLNDQKICVSTQRAVDLIKAACRIPCPNPSLRPPANELTKSAISLCPAKLLSENINQSLQKTGVSHEPP